MIKTFYFCYLKYFGRVQLINYVIRRVSISEIEIKVQNQFNRTELTLYIEVNITYLQNCSDRFPLRPTKKNDLTQDKIQMEGELSIQQQIILKKKIFFIHPKNKFWEIFIDGQRVTYRAGKLKDKQQHKSQVLEKTYSNQTAAKRTILQKIKEKLIKGYIVARESNAQNIKKQQIFSPQKINEQHKTQTDGTYLTELQQLKQYERQAELLQKREKSKSTTSTVSKDEKKKLKSILSQIDEKEKCKSIEQNKADIIDIESQGVNYKEIKYTGVKMSKEKLGVMYEIANNKVRITKFIDESSCGFEIKSFDTKQQALNFVQGQQQWYKGQDYDYQQFKNSFIIQERPTKPKQNQKQKTKKSSGSKQITLIDKTDESLVPITSQLYLDNSANIYKQEPRLGPPANGMSIKLLLADTWKEGVDPKGWLISQKLDGVRCFWTGNEMYSRNGNKFFFPNFFTRNWPKCQLDGQLFIGRGLFSHTISAVKKQNPVNFQWEKVRYLVFDAPGINKLPFKERYKTLKQIVSKIDNPFIKFHYHRQCKGFPDLFHQLELVNKKQGQGLMLRDPQSIYEFKRSKALLKVKTFHDDQAEIVGYNEGTGRFVGHVGSLKVVNKLGVHFDVGSGLNDQMRLDPPKVGQRIVFKYQQINKDTGRPRFPTFLRMFEDETSKK